MITNVRELASTRRGRVKLATVGLGTALALFFVYEGVEYHNRVNSLCSTAQELIDRPDTPADWKIEAATSCERFRGQNPYFTRFWWTVIAMGGVFLVLWIVGRTHEEGPPDPDPQESDL